MVLPALGELHSWVGKLLDGVQPKGQSLELLLAITDAQSLVSECGLANAFVEVRLGSYVQHTDCLLVQKLRIPVSSTDRILRLCFFALDSSNKFSPIPVPIHSLTIALDGIQWPADTQQSPVYMEWFALETPPRLDPVTDPKKLHTMLQTAIAFGANCEAPRVKMALQVKVCEVSRALSPVNRATSFTPASARSLLDNFPRTAGSFPRIASPPSSHASSRPCDHTAPAPTVPVPHAYDYPARAHGSLRSGHDPPARSRTMPQPPRVDSVASLDAPQHAHNDLVYEAAARLALYAPSACSSRSHLPPMDTAKGSVESTNPYGPSPLQYSSSSTIVPQQHQAGAPAMGSTSDLSLYSGRCGPAGAERVNAPANVSMGGGRDGVAGWCGADDGCAKVIPPPPPPAPPVHVPPPSALTYSSVHQSCSSDCPPPPPPPPKQAQPDKHRRHLYSMPQGYEYGSAKGDLLDEHVGYLLNVLHPELFRINDVERLRSSRYLINGREVTLKWDDEVICHDGPLRQPLREYLAHSDVDTDYSFADSLGLTTALSKIPKNQRLSFPRSRPMNRVEAMKIATQQAVLREYAAQESLNTRNDVEALQLSVAEMQRKMAQMSHRPSDASEGGS